jgi:hypothetical protein
MTQKLDAAPSTTVATIEVVSDVVRIHGLTIARPSVTAYLQTIAPEKQEIAFVHALEVGVTELAARRERVRKDRELVASPP